MSFLYLTLTFDLRLDQHAHNEITQRDLHEFEHQWKLPIMTLKNTPNNLDLDLKADLHETAPILNYICDQLWLRDQIMSGRVQAPDYSSQPKISFC